MTTQQNDSRTVLQAHKLRTELASGALILGSTHNRGRTISLRILVISLILAGVAVAGIVVTGYVIDLIATRRR
ncbi:MAG: hypothetical protein WAV90_15650 [Gordonia amarae]